MTKRRIQMTSGHITIYSGPKMQRIGVGPQTGQTRSLMNFSAHYGPIETEGNNRQAAVEKMIQHLRKMHAQGQLNSDVLMPSKFNTFDRYLVPESVLEQDVDAFVNWDLVKVEAAKK